MTLLAALTPELGSTGRMHLSRLAVLGNAPPVVGDGVVLSLRGELVVAIATLSTMMRSEREVCTVETLLLVQTPGCPRIASSQRI